MRRACTRSGAQLRGPRVQPVAAAPGRRPRPHRPVGEEFDATSPRPWTSSDRTARWRPSTRDGRTRTTPSRWRPTCRTTGCSRSAPADATSAGAARLGRQAASTTRPARRDPPHPRPVRCCCRNRRRNPFPATGTSPRRALPHVPPPPRTASCTAARTCPSRAIRSGLACNPTFLRLLAGDAVLDAVRLSRGFFEPGPVPRRPRRIDNSPTTGSGSPKPSRPPASSRSRDSNGRRHLPCGGRGRFGRDGLGGPASGRGLHHDHIESGSGRTVPTCGSSISGPTVPWALELTFRPGGVRRAPYRSARATGV